MIKWQLNRNGVGGAGYHNSYFIFAISSISLQTLVNVIGKAARGSYEDQGTKVKCLFHPISQEFVICFRLALFNDILNKV